MPQATVRKRSGLVNVERVCWQGMKQRCYNKNGKSYKNYGGRGIKICERWRNSFILFLKDMGRKPSPELSIDRIDNDGDYEPGNCRWATASQQARNTKRKPKSYIISAYVWPGIMARGQKVERNPALR